MIRRVPANSATASMHATVQYPAERPMGGYLALSTAWSDQSELLAQWIERALVDVAELPEKKPKSRRR
ncbi:MAG TPA: hypothetical protein VIJ18_17965 [Microbacteriaceae bacterium]